MPYIIKRVPINEDQVYKALYPRVDLVDEPDELIKERLVVIDTPFRHIGYFVKLAYFFLNKDIACGLVTDLPYDLSERALKLLKPFSFCFFFDQYILFSYPFAKEAAEAAVRMASLSDLTFLPRIGSLGYLEMRISEEKLPHTSIALSLNKDAFSFCDLISRKSKDLNQFKSLISCPRYLEVKAQEAAYNSEILDEGCDTIKVTRVYGLNEDQLLEQVENYRTSMDRLRQYSSV
jgi:hypothetical protein